MLHGTSGQGKGGSDKAECGLADATRIKREGAMNRITPDVDEVKRLRRDAPEGPILVVNLIKLRPGDTAREAYLGYRREAALGVPALVEVIHAGAAFADLCDDREQWDFVVITRYPHFDAFAATVSTPHYQATAARFRPDAIERTIMMVSPAGG
jgi:quinol monooxygenase YgiN